MFIDHAYIQYIKKTHLEYTEKKKQLKCSLLEFKTFLTLYLHLVVKKNYKNFIR